MKTHIYYFSGTGNSLNVARLLAEELGDCEIRFIPEVIGKELDPSFDRIGFVFPVYGWGLPLIVRDFLKKVRTDKYTFAVANYGGRPAGTLAQAERILKDNGTELKCSMGLRMPDNCIIISGAQPAEKRDEILRNARARVREIAAVIKDGRQCVERGSSIENWLLSGVMYGKAEGKFRTNDSAFKVDDRCKSCGSCVKICPVNNITLSDGRPQWHHKCEQCLACLHWCPGEAIQIGNKTTKKKRYRNPSVSREDMIRTRPTVR
jgi:ferredoxin